MLSSELGTWECPLHRSCDHISPWTPPVNGLTQVPLKRQFASKSPWSQGQAVRGEAVIPKGPGFAAPQLCDLPGPWFLRTIGDSKQLVSETLPVGWGRAAEDLDVENPSPGRCGEPLGGLGP